MPKNSVWLTFSKNVKAANVKKERFQMVNPLFFTCFRITFLKQVKQFVGGQPLLTNYNSRLPIVVYAAAGCEIRYRIWTASQTWGAADKKVTT